MSQQQLFSGPADEVLIYTDGASRGNPGPSSIGVSICTPDGDEIEAIAQAIGETTNNVAEYTAIVVALRRAAELGATVVELRSDSMLLIEQINGRYKVRAEHLKPLLADVQKATKAFERVRFKHVRREANTRADALANQALDADPAD